MKRPDELDLLQSTVKAFARQRRIAPYDTLMPLGFEVLETLENWEYHCTPVNSVTFGATGGDGVHFNLLTTGGGQGAIVMTSPVGEIPNVVVGSSMAEFLRLGYYACFGWLGDLAYDLSSAALGYHGNEQDLLEGGAELRDRLRDVFGLKPVEDVVKHLTVLQDRHLRDLILTAPDVWNKQHGV